MKKLLFALALLTAVAVASSAAAETVYVNMAGATAQVGFWKDAADDFLSTDASCASVTTPVEKEDNMIASGTNCTGLGLAGDDVIIRYSGFSSFTGFLGMCDLQTGYCTNTDEYPVLKESIAGGSTTEARVTDNCYDSNGVFLGEDIAGGQAGAADCDLTCAPINAAVSDVEANAFVQFTDGYDIKKGDDIPHPLPDFATVCPQLTSGDANFSRPLIVPFAFYVNNSVEKATCEVPIPAGTHVAYDPNGGDCEYDNAPGPDSQCRGYYKCIDGSCAAPYSKSCGSTSDCPFPADAQGNPLDGNCVIKPLDNLSRFQALQIFSGNAKNWREAFGPAYPNANLRACTRHAGSGTHATLDLAVMRGDLPLKTTDDLNSFVWEAGGYENPLNTLYAYVQSTSSSSLIACVADVPYAVGYADTDKLFGKSGNAHIVKYNGVYPEAKTIKNGQYNFWAAQVMGYLGSKMCGTSGDFTCKGAKVFDGLVNFITPGNLATYLPKKAAFWVTQSDMNVEKGSDFAYPSYK